jgi:hypothetical protein
MGWASRFHCGIGSGASSQAGGSRAAQMERRFALAEKRHEELRADMLARFEQIDQRFELAENRGGRRRQHRQAPTIADCPPRFAGVCRAY